MSFHWHELPVTTTCTARVVHPGGTPGWSYSAAKIAAMFQKSSTAYTSAKTRSPRTMQKSIRLLKFGQNTVSYGYLKILNQHRIMIKVRLDYIETPKSSRVYGLLYGLK